MAEHRSISSEAVLCSWESKIRITRVVHFQGFVSCPMDGGYAVAVPHPPRRVRPDNTEIVLHQTSPRSQTWKKKSMQDAWAEMGKFSVGLPTTTLLENGDVLVVYYSGPHTDQTDIK